MTDMRELQYRVEQLINRYVQCIDSDELEQWADFFTDPCLYQVIPRENWDQQLDGSLIYCDSQGMLRDRILSLRTANIFPFHNYRHLVSAVCIDKVDGDLIEVQSNYVVFITRQPSGETAIFNTGMYLDKIEDVGGSLKFRERTRNSLQ